MAPDPFALPVFAVGATICAYVAAAALHRAAGGVALLHPVLVATAAVTLLLWGAGESYDRYRAQAAPLHLALGVVVVMLAVPLHRHFPLLRGGAAGLATALLVGVATAKLSALAFPLATGAPYSLLATLTPKSTTTAVAVQLSEGLGGLPALTGLVVIATGLFGAAFGPPLLAAAGVRDPRAVGFALGVASHAIGTARAFQMGSLPGAFATLGMILTAILTIMLAPLLLALA